MNMRWMNLENTTLCTLFLLSVIYIKSSKIVISVCFLNYPCNKKYSENKSSPNALKFKYDFFWNIWEHLALSTHQGGIHLAMRVEGAPYPLGAPPASWAHYGPPPLIPAPTHSFLPQTPLSSSSTSSNSFCYDFRSPCSKHPSQNCFGGLFLGMWLLHWSN